MKSNENYEEIGSFRTDSFNKESVVKSGKSVFNGMHELHRKSLSSAVYNHEIFEELKERGKVSTVTFGPKETHQKAHLSFKETVESFLKKVDERRTEEQY